MTVNEAVTVNEAASGDEAAVALAGLLRVCEPPSAALALFVAKVGPVAASRIIDRIIRVQVPHCALQSQAA